MKPEPVTVEQLCALKGRELGKSDWFVIDQQRISAFGEVTEDLQYIHMDPDAAGRSPFGQTIAHGFLTLSMLSAMAYAGMPAIEDVSMSVNYGLNHVRFVAPVKSGQRVRGVFVLKDFAERSSARWSLTVEATVEIENEPKPAVVAEWVTLVFLA